MRHNFFLISFLFIGCIVFRAANADTVADADTIKMFTMEEVVISSTKETNSLNKHPGAVSLLTLSQIGNIQLNDIKGLSTVVPNMFIPNYGSKMTSAVYIRGVGARSSGQAIGMYVDNVPFLDKSAFDFDLVDVQRIEILRGAQGTLYGRNAMGGIVNVYTLSPFDYQGIRANFTVGNEGYYKATLSHYQKVSDKFAFSLGGYYNQNNGFFTNEYTGKRADRLRSGGAKARIQYRPKKNLKVEYTFMYDYVTQGAFPYGRYDTLTHIVSPVNFNDKSSYLRHTCTNSLFLEYRYNKFILSSTTAYRLLNDNMQMDQDYTPKNIFTLQQRQLGNAVTEEVAIRSNTLSNYQWSGGGYAFYDGMRTKAPVVFKQDGINEILQPVFDNLTADNPNAPRLQIRDNRINIPGVYHTPSVGGALFHQSTYNNLFIERLSLTAGLRLDYEKAHLDYNAYSKIWFNVFLPQSPDPIPFPIDTALAGKVSADFWQLLPKVALKYDFNPRNFVYASVAKGYKAGGYNIQLFADLMQEALKEKGMLEGNPLWTPDQSNRNDVGDATRYNPEYTWNYEVGSKNELVREHLFLNLTLFYMDVKNIQLTKFVDSGSGRYLSNGGKARTLGVETSLSAKVIDNMNVAVNYGYTNARFRDYEDKGVDYSGNFIPYAPQHTLSLDASYRLSLQSIIIDHILFAAQCNGAGVIYWTEKNNISQKFYTLLNARILFQKGNFGAGLWGRNLVNTNYKAFYFESFSNSFVQKGVPIQFGAEILIRL